MIYVALLRGINVGGNNKVEMKKLKTSFEEAGMQNVKTYINSGNVIFRDEKYTQKQLTKMLESAIEKDFNLKIKVLLRTIKDIEKINKNLPTTWKNDSTMKCDVMFLWEEIDSPDILNQLPKTPATEDLNYLPGTVIWRVDRENLTKSPILKIVGTKIYKQMTIRNCNTIRKLLELMQYSC